MKLHELSNTPGSVHRKKRVGNGRGNGHGKTCGRGGKGQTARSGSSIRPGFEGGQMPLYRKLPHRGFNQTAFQTETSIVNLGQLAKLDEAITEINAEVLVKNGLIRRGVTQFKVLGEGELTRAVTVTATKFSDSAKAKIEQAGGQAIVAA